LDLSDNELSTLPASIVNLTNLGLVQLYNNYLKDDTKKVLSYLQSNGVNVRY